MRLSQLIVLGVLLGLGAGWWLHRDMDEPMTDALPEAPSTVAAAPVTEPVAPGATAPPASTAPPAAQAADAPSGLLLPVQGILPSQLHDTFSDARSEGRVHDAIDILADAGTPVLAVADGTVEKLFDSERGGLTIYQFEPSGQWCYYYAHLQRYADGLAEKQVIKRGEVIGYVGSTGNASAETPHLHFEVHVLGPEKQWWKGESINPYPLLKSAAMMPGAASVAMPQ
ncbi:M23 family metallopeptidase [Stenotrophomonas maltophilia]|uniref:M23 family metallopeptidase n=1 Tax=Stenotrophomonas maltophilia TaxID=40324 RepID=UPI0019D4EB13|nr:M23 family metallopeptidase [Stenotrophomonas maltophilia]MBN7830589.1 M23 family metallopeptidase [Stenotrophomonas maltophilia]MBN7834276.1 M23 family metallopeptidase [Stenotrophomonas maltophilia]MBN7858716.1 M23 family metallopeptidase [Stenotrophomonas maltophilia]MBN7916677.1 M23 family metallopeptidase [Stenotrophomonas maltophilia]MBO2845911.1 M23 family metallopeptidase [Stenotrophomonas maltophilia]